MIPIIRIIFCAISIVGLTVSADIRPAFSQTHIRDLDGIRTAMTELGNTMPGIIRKAEPKDIRTLERIFEINTYALTTIEAYLKMIKVAVSSEGNINKEIIDIFNGWLEFIEKYCKKDVEYLDEALSETQDQAIVTLIQKSKKNIIDLGAISGRARDENVRMLSGSKR